MRKVAILPFLVSAFLWTAPVWAQFTPGSTGLTQTAGAANFATDDANANISTFIGAYIIQPVFGLVAILALVLFLYAGVLWMTAAGDDKKVGKAKSIMRDVVIGTVILAASYALVDLIIKSLSDSTVPPT